MCIISALICLLLLECIYNNYNYQQLKNNNIYLESFFIWLPLIILIILLIPTLYYLYDINYIYDITVEVKVVGLSWNWIVTIN